MVPGVRIAVGACVAVLAAGAFIIPGGGEDNAPVEVQNLPRLVDLGASMCIPCREMAVELALLDSLTGDALVVELIDVNENQDAASLYGIQVIPTQILFDASGIEVWRHTGVISAGDMIQVIESKGIDLGIEEN